MAHLPAKDLQRSNYRLLGLVGQGQFGRVYCAIHRKTGRIVALKALDKQRFPTHRFLRELRFLLSLEHPNIVTCQALEHTQSDRYLVMDYCEGGTLRSLLEEDIRLQPLQGLALIEDVLAGLAHAHGRGVVHCDIKPENILLTLQAQGWTARISDFGIARLSRDLHPIEAGNTGSPAYMAPERFYGQYSYASDLYAVGVLLYEMLCGQRPFAGTPEQLMSAHLNQSVAFAVELPQVLQTIVTTALQKLPARRFASAEAMLLALQSARQQLGQPWLRHTWGSDNLLLAQSFGPECEFASFYQFAVPRAEPIAQLWWEAASASGRANAGTACPGAGGHDFRPARAGLLGMGLGWLSSGTLGFQPISQAWLESVRGDEVLEPGWQWEMPQAIAPASMAIALHGQYPQGRCWTAWNSQTVYQGRWPPSDLTASGAEPGTTGAADIQAIAAFSPSGMTLVAPSGKWMATLTALEPDRSLLEFWHWPGGRGPGPELRRPVQTALICLAQQPDAGVVLDEHHVMFFRELTATGSSTGRATYLELFTRRGQPIGAMTLEVAVQQLSLGAQPFQLVGLESAYPQTLLFIHLKPFKLTRIGLKLRPWRWTTTPWGYVVGDRPGNLVLLNLYGHILGEVQAPQVNSTQVNSTQANSAQFGVELTALAMIGSDRLAIALWDGSTATIHLVDLTALGLDIIF